MELRYHDDGATRATSWVFKVASCALPTFGFALDHAQKNGHSIGLHMASRSMIVRFASDETKAFAESKMRVIFSKGGAKDVKFESVEALDPFHGESWGLIAMNGPPRMPEEPFDKVIFEDELSDGEEPESDCEEPELPAAPIPETLSQQVVPSDPDIFALVAPISRKTIVVPDLVKAMKIEASHEREVRNVLEEKGGPLSPWLKERVFPANKQHCLDVQAEYEALARKKPTDPINWITGPAPRFLDIYFKPNMSLERRVAWIQFKADKLKILLTYPVFMGFFKQVTDYADPDNRLKMYKTAVNVWRGGGFNWKDLDKATRNLIQNINVDKLDCYCKNCRQVLPVGDTRGFCSKYCSLQYCNCGLKFQTRKVIDNEAWTTQTERLGHYRSLADLVEMLPLKDEVDKYQTLPDINVEFAKLDDLKRDEGCRTGFNGYFPAMCTRCKTMFTHLGDVQRALDKISTGKVTWGHCDAAKQVLERLESMPIPKMDQKFCETCTPCKKARTQ